MKSAALAIALLLAMPPARADDTRLGRVAQALKPGTPYHEARARLRRTGWQPYTYRRSTPCRDEPKPCRIYPEFRSCWAEGSTVCSFEFLETKRRPPRLSDMVLNVRVRLEPDGRLLYESHDITSFGGHG